MGYRSQQLWWEIGRPIAATFIGLACVACLIGFAMAVYHWPWFLMIIIVPMFLWMCYLLGMSFMEW